MKSKLILSFLLVCFMVSTASAQYLIGSRASGMGGAAVAVCNDITAAYYNPAGLMRSKAKVGEVKVSLGAAPEGLTQLSALSSNIGDPAQFLITNFNDNISVGSSFSGIFGAQIKKVGISLIPLGLVNVNKPAGLAASSVDGDLYYNGVLTLGHTFSLPFLPAALDVGTNVKALNYMYGNVNVAPNAGLTKAEGTQTWGTGTGLGFDLGAVTTFSVPFLTELAAGVVIRDISSSVNLSSKQKSVTVEVSGDLTEGAEVDLGTSTQNIDPSTAIGVSGKIPGVGIILAADIVSGNNASSTHFGLEYPLAAGLATLRAGLASGKMVSMANPGTEASLTTFGAKLNLFVIGMDVAYILDSTDSKNNTFTFDFGGAF